MYRRIFTIVLCFGFLVSGSTMAVPTGTELVEAIKSDLWNSTDTDWIDSVVVSVAPTRIYMPSWSDEKRQKFFDDFDPDFLDMWSGAAMNRGDFFRMRGVAVNYPMEYEYQEALNSTAHYGWTLFGRNGVAMKEDGSVAMRRFTPQFTTQCMCNLAPKWEETVRQGVIRPGVFSDALFQDNIANPIYTWNQGFCNWCNRRFITFMTERFSTEELQGMGFDPSEFRIVGYMKEKRELYSVGTKENSEQVLQEQELKSSANDRLLEDPILREYIRFQHIANMSLVVEKAEALKQTAANLGRPIPAFYGNIPRISGMRAFPTIMASQVDIPWTEVSTDFQPSFYAGRQAWSTLLYKVGRAVAGYSKPVFAVQYHGGAHRSYRGDEKKMPLALPLAEAHANGGVPVQTWVATEYKYLMKNPDWEKNLYDVNSAHARFVGKNRVLFTDRTQVAHVALVHSLTSTFWRQFQSLTVPREHLPHFTAAARFLEDRHIPYEVLPLGHPDIFDDTPMLAGLEKYDALIIPEADCVSDAQADALRQWVRSGGSLILWGTVGTRDEDMHHRTIPVFDDLINHPGNGAVRMLDRELTDSYVQGDVIMPNSKEEPHAWRYTVTTPPSDWINSDFNDLSWDTGMAPFGSKVVLSISPATSWTAPEIYLRREFELTEDMALGNLFFDMMHWWDAEVYINGVLAAKAPERGLIFESYQTVDLLPAAKAALKPGRNVIAIHCRVNEAHASWGQMIDAGLVNLSDGRRLAEDMQLPGALLDTDLPSSTWVNVWRHGAGPMTTVQLVNYNLDLESDTMAPVSNFTIRLNLPEAARITQADWFAADYVSEDSPAPISLSLAKGDGWVEVQVPRLDLFGVLVFSAEQELEARTVASQARKEFERTRIAKRCLSGTPVMDAALETRVRKQLATIQGDVAVEDFSPVGSDLKSLVAELKECRETVFDMVVASKQRARDEMIAAVGSYKFDFGTENTVDGWIAVTPDTSYTKDRGYGWTVNEDVVSVNRELPDALHGDFIRNIDPAESNWPNKGKSGGYPFPRPSHRPGEFRIDLSNGHYRVTVISGDYSVLSFKGGGTANEGKAASTYVHANGKLKLIGDTLRSGVFDNRAFEVDVTDGRLDLRFSGANVGPLYCNTIEWLVNGLLIQRLDQPPTEAAAESVAENKLREQIAILDWQLLGPFDDSEYLGMEQTFGPERNTDGSVVWEGRNGKISWRQWTQNSDEQPCVPFGNLYGTEEGIAAFAMARVACPSETDAVLHVSMSQRGEVYLNGEKIYRDEYAAGFLPEEARLPVQLKAGTNTILLKSLHHWGDDWAVWAGLSTLDGMPLK